MSFYTDKQYFAELPKNAIKDLKILFFDTFLKNCDNMLDIGCSVGRIIALNPKNFQGIDIDEKAIKIGIEKGYNIKYADIREKLPFKNEFFDAIYCSQLIEHLDTPLHLMKEIKRVLKKGGKAVIITPDYILSSRKYKDGFWSDYTHKTPFIPEALEKICYDAGFNKFRIYNYPSFGFRHLMRLNLLSKENWIKLQKLPFIWKGQDLILEISKMI